ncbi:hypothetical protein DPMN_012917 [Dreissena polymorpha]|uniref:Receptor ligand binding region domain-containing protein n=1 Tax=Dreissena polymorpha TaxID=45954 RepID=A0A9D4N4C7_DREPO|nr:hypothetical protein DPMN_012917 [Dreissena polymorpha]
MRLHFLSLWALSVAATCQAQTLEQQTCNVDRMYADHNMAAADVALGFVAELRDASSTGTGCGEVGYEYVMLWEAARWTVNQLNSNNYVNGVKFGLRGYDTCGSAHRAIASMNHFYQQFSASSMYCNQTSSKLNLGVVGTMSSTTTKPIAALSTNFPTSVISPLAVSPQLSDKSEYPYFLRTRFSAVDQIKTMLSTMVTLKWERIIIIYTDNDYGRDYYNEFIKLSQNNQVCVVAAISVPGSPNLPAYMERLKAVGTLDVTAAAFFGVHSAATMMLSAIENLNNSAQNLQFMLTSLNLGLPITVNRARGLLVVLPSYTEVTEFYDYWTASIDANNPPPENPWYKDWFMRTFQCRLQGVNYEPYVRYSDCDPKSPAQKRAATNTRIPYLDTTVKAVLTYAKALKTAHQQTCGNQPGLCLGLRQMTAEQFHNNYLKVVDFDLNEFGITSLNGKRVKYDITGDFYMAGHDIFNANNQPIGGAFTFKKVGDFMDGKLNLNTSLMYFYNDPRTAPLPSIPTSPCPPSGCKNCLVPREMVHFNYKPGDIVLAGLFDLHSQGSEVLTCGSLKAVHALNAAAFTFAVERVKQQFSILPGVNLGSLIIDLCDNAETGRILLNDLLAGRTIVADVHGTVVDPNLIYTVVGELDSTEAMSMATMLGYFSRPYIESSATSVELSNKDKYEMFSRAVPSDYHQMMAIVLLLKKMNWNYVQVVHSPNAYGRTGYKTIRDEGAKRSICVATSQEIGKDGTLATIVRNLNEKPEARIVIAIVDSYDYRTMLQALKDQNLVGRFILIGTETWGKRMSIVSGLQSAAEGSITLDIDGPNIQDFRTWLDGKNPSDMTIARDMPFLVEWYQYAYSCYLDAQNKGVYTNQCNPNLPLTQATKYEESAYTPFMITATYAAARAIDATLRVYCGDANRNYNGICWQFRSNRMVPVNIQDYLENSTFNLDAFPFKMVDGEGKASYSIYSYSGGLYTKIGTYLTERSELSMPQNPASLPAGFTSVCSGSCSECVYLVQTEPFWSIPFKDLNLGVNFAAHDPGSEPFLCSGIRLTNGFQSYLAVKYAIEQVNNKLAPVGLNNVSLGAFMLDHCNSPARAYGMPAALYSGIFDTMFEGAPNLNTIRGWLTDNNLVTAEMKDFFSDFNLPVISTMGSANKFLNDEEYPTFARTFQGDSTIASALAVFIQSMGFRYVSFVYSDDEDGRTGLETFKDIAVKEGICIIKAIQMGNMTDDALVADLVALPSHVVVTYIGQGDMDKLLTARGKNSVADGLLIISPEPYPMLLYRHGLAAKNVLSLRMKTNVLEKYQKSLTDITDFSQSIMREYYMALFKCNLPGEYRYSTSCGPLQKLTSSPIFYQDNYILPIINAVYSFVQAAHHTLREQCGDNYNGMCARFYTDVDTNSILYDKLKTIGFSDDSRSTFSFIGQEGNTRREIALFDGAKMRTFADFTGATIEGVNVNTFKT